MGDGVCSECMLRMPNPGLARDATNVQFHGPADQPESSSNSVARCLTLFLNRLLECIESRVKMVVKVADF